MTMRHAIYTAVDVLRNRINYDEPLKNPLPKLYHEKRDDSEKARFTVRPKDQFKKEPRAPRGESAPNSTEETAK
jgi:4-hydroxythreonine-4-phosphate dehydrogenase